MIKIQKKDKKKKNIQTKLNKHQGKRKKEELYELLLKYKELNNPMIYSGYTKDLSALLSHNPSPAFKD